MKHLALLILILSGFIASAQIPSTEVQIKTALLAAPEDQRAEAKFMGTMRKANLWFCEKELMN